MRWYGGRLAGYSRNCSNYVDISIAGWFGGSLERIGNRTADYLVAGCLRCTSSTLEMDNRVFDMVARTKR
jgi:hypothetical protein